MSTIDPSIIAGVKPFEFKGIAQSRREAVALKDMAQQRVLRDQSIEQNKLGLEEQRVGMADKAALQKRLKTIAEIDQANTVFNEETGEFDTNEANAIKSLNLIDPEAARMYQAERVNIRTARTTRKLNELKEHAEGARQIAGRVAGFLDLPFQNKQPQYAKFRSEMAQYDPKILKDWPAVWGAEANKKLQNVKKEYEAYEKQTMTAAERINEAQEKRLQEEADAKKEALIEVTPGASMWDPKQKKFVGTAPKDDKPSDKQIENDLIWEAYAESIKKPVAQLTASDKIKAGTWHKNLAPDAKTDFDKRLALLKDDPETYEKLYPGSGATTPSQRGNFIQGIFNDIQQLQANGTMDKEDAAAAKAYYENRRRLLKETGVDIPAYEKAPKFVGPTQPAIVPKAATAKPPVGPNLPATVKMKAPDGSVQDVPADQVDHYKSLGAIVVK